MATSNRQHKDKPIKLPVNRIISLKGRPENLLRFLILAILLAGFATAINHAPAQADDQQSYLVKSATEKWLAGCQMQRCVNSGLQTITKLYGTQVGLDSLERYVFDVPNSLPGDNHLRAHYVGYATEEKYGMSSKAFLSCSLIFNHGCMHGFLEKAIEQGITPARAAAILCDPIQSSHSYTSNMKYYCYHGIGHGAMAYTDYDLSAALKICDSLSSNLAHSGCWQGVFMENDSGITVDSIDNGTYSKTDPLAPCDNMEAKYQRECYITHEGYLFRFYKYDAHKAANACLGAGEQVGSCMEGVGLAASSDVWQTILLRDKKADSLEENAWNICKQFPDGYVPTCVAGAVTQILQTDEFDYGRVSKLCSLVSAPSKPACYRRIGEYTRLENLDTAKAVSYCTQLPEDWRQACRDGAKSYD